MKCRLSQLSHEPGATLNVRAVLTEYGAPLQGSASVKGADLPMFITPPSEAEPL
jgi:hypothetical protein